MDVTLLTWPGGGGRMACAIKVPSQIGFPHWGVGGRGDLDLSLTWDGMQRLVPGRLQMRMGEANSQSFRNTPYPDDLGVVNASQLGHRGCSPERQCSTNWVTLT